MMTVLGGLAELALMLSPVAVDDPEAYALTVPEAMAETAGDDLIQTISDEVLIAPYASTDPYVAQATNPVYSCVVNNRYGFTGIRFSDGARDGDYFIESTTDCNLDMGSLAVLTELRALGFNSGKVYEHGNDDDGCLGPPYGVGCIHVHAGERQGCDDENSHEVNWCRNNWEMYAEVSLELPPGWFWTSTGHRSCRLRGTPGVDHTLLCEFRYFD